MSGQHAVATLDLAKAFDWVDPSELCSMFEFLGMPQQMVGCLRALWSSQRRWLTWRTAVSEQPCWAGSSLPQGDPMSPLGMLAYLSCVARDLSRTAPTVRASFFVDDRTLSASDGDALLNAVQITTQWSQRLGLQENVEKLALLPRTQAQRTVFDQRLPGKSQDSVRVLGVDLGQRRGQASLPVARERAAQALVRGHRLRWLLVALGRLAADGVFQVFVGLVDLPLARAKAGPGLPNLLEGFQAGSVRALCWVL